MSNSATSHKVLQCPENGPEHRVHSRNAIHSENDVLVLESKIESEALWFVRLGEIVATRVPAGSLMSGRLTLSDQGLAKLPLPGTLRKRPGRLNPAYGQRNDVLQLFESMFESISTWAKKLDYLDSDGLLTGHALKEVKIAPAQLQSIANATIESGESTDIVEASFVEYWDDPRDPSLFLSDEMLTGDLSRYLLVESRWDARKGYFTTRVRSV